MDGLNIKKELEEVTLDYTIVKEEYSIDEKTTDSEKENGEVLDTLETVKYEITEIEQTDNVESDQSNRQENHNPNHPNPNNENFYLLSYPAYQQNPPPLSMLPPVPDKSYHESFPCLECCKTYGSRKSLNRHMKIHKEGVSFPCPVCQKPFKTASYLRNHMIIHGEKRHACEICGKKFVDKAHVTRHIKQMHESKKQVKKIYICQHCGKVLRDKCRYTNHMKVHEEKTIDCPDPNCFLKFKYQHNLVKHMAIHSAEKPFECPKCPRKFKSKPVLVNHMRIHEQEPPTFACGICNKTFQVKRNLRKHIQQHSTSKERVSCPYCGQSLWRMNLQAHKERRHRDLYLIETKKLSVVKVEKVEKN